MISLEKVFKYLQVPATQIFVLYAKAEDHDSLSWI